MPHMQFGAGGFIGGSQLSFGGNSFGAMMAGGYQQTSMNADDEFMSMNAVP